MSPGREARPPWTGAGEFVSEGRGDEFGREPVSSCQPSEESLGLRGRRGAERLAGGKGLCDGASQEQS